MKVLTTDLDRTFIFSTRTVGRSPGELICIERLDGRDISFVSPAIIEQLQALTDEQLIIPVTTRALHQYERITLFQDIYKPKYAIVANGGVVLIDGKRDTKWDAIIQEAAQQCMSFTELAQVFQQQWQHPMVRVVADADQLFYVLMLHEELIDLPALAQLTEELAKVGWTGYKNGRKFYMLPHFLKKEAAVQYVLSQLSYEQHIAAGDSIMDFGMLKIADAAFTPAHGELCKDVAELGEVQILEERGIDFTEQLMQRMLFSLSERK